MRDELDEHSPSRVSREIFRNVGRGGVLGFKDEEENLAKAARVFADGGIKEMLGAANTATKTTPTTQAPPVRAGTIIEKIEVHIVSSDSEIKNSTVATRVARAIGYAADSEMRIRGVIPMG
jgi:hypothetical protein